MQVCASRAPPDPPAPAAEERERERESESPPLPSPPQPQTRAGDEALATAATPPRAPLVTHSSFLSPPDTTAVRQAYTSPRTPRRRRPSHARP